jgi:hypothetical protein
VARESALSEERLEKQRVLAELEHLRTELGGARRRLSGLSLQVGDRLDSVLTLSSTFTSAFTLDFCIGHWPSNRLRTKLGGARRRLSGLSLAGKVLVLSYKAGTVVYWRRQIYACPWWARVVVSCYLETMHRSRSLPPSTNVYASIGD